MEIKFLAIAELELIDAVKFYNQQSEGLGYEFAAEIKRTLGRILHYPKDWNPFSNRTRRCRTNRFPYGIIYQICSDEILIIAVMHLHKRPDSWKSRI